MVTKFGIVGDGGFGFVLVVVFVAYENEWSVILVFGSGGFLGRVGGDDDWVCDGRHDVFFFLLFVVLVERVMMVVGGCCLCLSVCGF